MAAIPQMTWNWKWKLAATGVTALAGWFASPVQSPLSHAPAATGARATAAESTANAATVSDIEEQARRLIVRTAPLAGLPPAQRNLFQFRPKPVPHPRVNEHARDAIVPIAPPAPVPFPLRLTGIGVDTVNGVARRTAIISGPASLELAAVGDVAAPGYRVVAVGESFVDVERVSDGARERLLLKP